MSRYLFADSTPFPIQEDFLDTLSAMVDAAVELLELNAKAERASDRSTAAEVEAELELSSLDELSHTLASALFVFDGTDRAREAVAGICRHSQEIIESKRADVERRRQHSLQAARAQYAAGEPVRVLTQLLNCYRLPSTEWHIRWRAGDIDHAAVTAVTPVGIAAEFGVDLPEAQPCTQPIHVGDMASELRRFAPGAHDSLVGWFVTEIEQGREGTWMRLSTNGASHEHAPGMVVVLRNDGARSTMTPVYDNPGEPIDLAGGNLAAFERLRDKALAALAPLVAHRSAVRTVSYCGCAVQELDRPGAIAEAIIEAIAPLTSEIRSRSATGELTLKRELGDGRREEIFMSQDAITEKFARLPWQQRRKFEPLCLGTGIESGEIVVEIDYAA